MRRRLARSSVSSPFPIPTRKGIIGREISKVERELLSSYSFSTIEKVVNLIYAEIKKRGEIPPKIPFKEVEKKLSSIEEKEVAENLLLHLKLQGLLNYGEESKIEAEIELSFKVNKKEELFSLKIPLLRNFLLNKYHVKEEDFPYAFLFLAITDGLVLEKPWKVEELNLKGNKLFVTYSAHSYSFYVRNETVLFYHLAKRKSDAFIFDPTRFKTFLKKLIRKYREVENDHFPEVSLKEFVRAARASLSLSRGFPPFLVSALSQAKHFRRKKMEEEEEKEWKRKGERFLYQDRRIRSLNKVFLVVKKIVKEEGNDLVRELEDYLEGYPFGGEYIPHEKKFIEWILLKAKRGLTRKTLSFCCGVAEKFNIYICGWENESEVSVERVKKYCLVVLKKFYSKDSSREKAARYLKDYIKTCYDLEIDFWIPVKKPKTAGKCISLSEFKRILSSLPTEVKGHCGNLDYLEEVRAFLLILYFLGLRRGEALSLTLGDFEWGKFGKLCVRGTKTSSSRRDVPLVLLPEKFRKEVQLLWREKLRLNRGKKLSEVPFFEIPESLIRSLWKRLKKYTPHFNYHNLRHSFATYFIRDSFALLYGEKGENLLENRLSLYSAEDKEMFLYLIKRGSKINSYIIQTLSKMLGHSSARTTLSIYIHEVLHLTRLFNRQEETVLGVKRVMEITSFSHRRLKNNDLIDKNKVPLSKFNAYLESGGRPRRKRIEEVI